MITKESVEALIKEHEDDAKRLQQGSGFPLCETATHIKRIVAWLKASDNNVDEFLANVDHGKVGPNGIVGQTWTSFFESLGDHATANKLRTLKVKAPTEDMQKQLRWIEQELIKSHNQKELTPRLEPHGDEWNRYQVLIAGYGNRARRKKLSHILTKIRDVGSAHYQKGELSYLFDTKRRVAERKALRAEQIPVLIEEVKSIIHELRTSHKDKKLADEIENANLKGAQIVTQLVHYREEVRFLEKIREKLMEEERQKDWPFFKKHSSDGKNGWQHIIRHIEHAYKDHKTAQYFENYCTRRNILDTIKGLNDVVGYVTMERRRKEIMDGAIDLVHERISHKETVLERYKEKLLSSVQRMTEERIKEVGKLKKNGYKMCVRIVDDRRKVMTKRLSKVMKTHQELMDTLYNKLANGQLNANELNAEAQRIEELYKEKIPYYNANRTIFQNLVALAKSKYPWNLNTTHWAKGAIHSVVENQKHINMPNKEAMRIGKMHDKLLNKIDSYKQPVLVTLRKLKAFRDKTLLPREAALVRV